jgi:hypothetical protein
LGSKDRSSLATVVRVVTQPPRALIDHFGQGYASPKARVTTSAANT